MAKQHITNGFVSEEERGQNGTGITYFADVIYKAVSPTNSGENNARFSFVDTV